MSDARTGTSSSWAAPGSSAATSCARLLAARRRRTRRRLRQLHLGTTLAPRGRSPTIRGSTSSRARSTTSTGLDACDGGRDRGRPPRVQPRHRPCDDRPDDRLRPGHAAHALRRRGGAPIGGRARPLRVGQRRLRRPRRPRGRRALRPARTGVDLRREQARGRGPDRVVLPHVRHARSCLPLRQRRRAPTRPTASASTSCASCSPIPTRLEILGDGTPEQVVRPRRRRARRRAARGRDRRRAVRRVQRRDRRLHHRRRDRRARGRVPRARPRHGRARLQRWGPGVEGRRARRAHRHRAHPRARVGEPLQLARGAARARSLSMLDDARAGRLW